MNKLLFADSAGPTWQVTVTMARCWVNGQASCSQLANHPASRPSAGGWPCSSPRSVATATADHGGVPGSSPQRRALPCPAGSALTAAAALPPRSLPAHCGLTPVPLPLPPAALLPRRRCTTTRTTRWRPCCPPASSPLRTARLQRWLMWGWQRPSPCTTTWRSTTVGGLRQHARSVI